MEHAEARAVLPEATFRLVRELLHDRYGLWFHDHLRFLLEYRLGPRLASLGLRDFDAYQRFLRLDPRGPEELLAAAEVLATHETYFYREPAQLRAFERDILADLAQERGDTRRLRILSAGCATGEEAYTVAALLVDSGRFTGWDLEVQAVDLSRRCLAQASSGVYGEAAFRSAEGMSLRHWFHLREGRWTVAPALRRLVQFCAANLLDGEGVPPGPYDVILCRNVLLYLDLPARRRVLANLHAGLGPGGWLLLGHAESLLEPSDGFVPVRLDREVVFRRRRAEAGGTG
jgi:chemotaxis protein methyltransferase CheR